MSRHLYGVVLLGVIALALGHQALAGGAVVAMTLDRTLEPVIVKGADLPDFLGAPVEHLFVYAYRDGAWVQIPAQVDEVTAEGKYTALEDGVLDGNDEVVFMAQDLGDRVPGMAPMEGGQPIAARWYEIAVVDPLDPAKKGFAYVVRSSTLSRTFTADYVSFDLDQHRLIGVTYRLGFATPKPWIDYLAFAGNETDILDRTKTRLFCRVPVICPITEAKLPDLQDDLIKDGPVRVIVRGGRVQAYAAMAAWRTSIDLPEGLAGDMRLSTDFNDAVVGATFYSAVVPQGVTVDGQPDTVSSTPLSPWWQLSTSWGTVLQVSDTSPIGGEQNNYYVDNAAIDTSDTGDQKHYADTGVYIVNPNLSFTYRFTIYFLPESQPNLGEMYASYFSQPLSVTAQLQRLELPEKVFLPVVIR